MKKLCIPAYNYVISKNEIINSLYKKQLKLNTKSRFKLNMIKIYKEIKI